MKILAEDQKPIVLTEIVARLPTRFGIAREADEWKAPVARPARVLPAGRIVPILS